MTVAGRLGGRLGCRLGWGLAGLLLLALAVAAAIAGARLAALHAEVKLRAALDPPESTAESTAETGGTPDGWEAAARRVVLIGDSRILRWEPLPHTPNLAVRVRGVGGETTRATRARFRADALGPRPDAVVLMSGINDMTAAALNPAHAEHLIAGAAENLAAMAAMAKEADVPLILADAVRPAEPGIVRRLFAWDGAIHGLTARLNARIAAIAAPDTGAPGVTLLSADRLLAGDAPAGTPLPDAYAADALHLTAEAYAVLNGALLATLDGLPSPAATPSAEARRP